MNCENMYFSLGLLSVIPDLFCFPELTFHSSIDGRYELKKGL